MAISSLRYRPGAHPPEESKHGYVVFNGDPKDYHHWLFRTRLKIKTCKQDEFPRVAQNVVENLRGEALQVAIEIGIDTLVQSDGSGLDTLIEKMSRHTFPIAQHESKELYREGHKTRDGALTRQNGESMQGYILRRKRWWQLLKQLENTVALSDEHLGDMLLDGANILDWQKQLILTTTTNSTEFDKVADALMVQLGRIHIVKDRSYGGHHRQEDRSYKPPRPPFRPRFHRQAHLASEKTYAEDEGDEVGGSDEYEPEDAIDLDIEDDRLAVQLNVLDELEWANEGELPSSEVIADVVQTELVAHAAWTDFGKGKGKGKSKSKDSKGRGKCYAPKGSSKGKHGVRKGSVPLEEKKNGWKS